MRIDRTHRPWGAAFGILAAVAALTYVVNSVETGPARGGSALGLTFGSIGYALMLYAALLGVRKKVPTWRLGRAQAWMRGHLWLGLLSFLLILFHSGLRFRGPLTGALMIVFPVVIASGLLGAVLQHFLPRVLTVRVPMETIYDEIPHVRAQLREEADRLAAVICGPLEDSDGRAGGQFQNTPAEAEADDRARFREVYLRKIRPFLNNPDAPDTELGSPQRSTEVFGTLRNLIAAPARDALDAVENLCEEERQLSRQIRLHRWLHAWLLVHVPLSVALLVLATIHALVALRY